MLKKTIIALVVTVVGAFVVGAFVNRHQEN